MTLKNKLNLFAMLCLLFVGFASCTEDPLYVEEGKGTITLDDVLLEQTVNEKASFTMTDKDEELTYLSQISFADKQIKWANPVLEQTLDDVLKIQEDKITVTNAQGTKITSVDVKVVANKVEVSFLKVGGNYDYMSVGQFHLNILANLKPTATDEELEALKEKGFSTQSIFHIEGETKQVKSNLVTVYPPNAEPVEPGFDEKGDPRNSEYKYQLNVIYFVPSDIEENPNYKERLSKILFQHQLFAMKWMKHWGYEEKSYGLDLDEQGMVNIILVKGKEVKANYPYSGGAAKMIEEIHNHYIANQMGFKSQHALILTALNDELGGGAIAATVPFYGYGKYCFAIDYPGMSQGSMGLGTPESAIASQWIGGMLHELGHGLNMPHVGPSKSHLADPNFGVALMAWGNYTYGKDPTYLHESSAAVLNNCQIASFTEKTFYDATTASVKITDVIINGSQCTVKGSFEASKPVTDVIVRFHKSTEAHLGAGDGYTSVAFSVKPNADKTFEKTFDIEELKVNNSDYKMGVAILLENGNTASASRSDVYRQENNTLVNLNLNQSKWTATASHAMPADAVENNSPQNLIDGNGATILALVKPGASYGGVTVAAGEQVFATIDMSEQMTFNTILLSFRGDNPNEWLRATKVSFFGSNDGTTFEAIKENNELDVTKGSATISLPTAANYRYLKMTYDAWHPSGSTMQFAELGLQNQ